MIETLHVAVQRARRQLSAFLSDREAEREARLLICDAAEISGAYLFAHLDEGWPSARAAQAFERNLAARLKRRPLSQILGRAEFYGRSFVISPDVLTPRADTETLVDHALAQPFVRVLDLGTGSGCILATLLAERRDASGIGVDLSDAACAVARINLDALAISDRASIIRSDWFERVTGRFDLIVSNPPYISESEMLQLMPEVRDWEPQLALTPGGDGLACYRQIVEGVPHHLSENGRLIVEIGHQQGGAVTALFEEAGFQSVTLHHDLAGRARVICGEWHQRMSPEP